jgi:lipid II:glycine glycyltransferase (peptidoglycan interpeptide bridge formation enzyme)
VLIPTRLGRSTLAVPRGPVWEYEAPEGPALLGAMVDALRGVARANRAYVVVVEPRALLDPAATSPLEQMRIVGLRHTGRSTQPMPTRVVDLLDGGERLAASWHADARRRSRRSVREGVTVTIDHVGDPTMVSAFADLMRTTAERAGFRPRPAAFLDALAMGCAKRGDWTLALGWVDRRPVAGVVAPRTGDRAFYLFAASLREPALRHAYASYAVMAAAMAELAAGGVRSLDLWGVAETADTALGPGLAGVSAFKHKFGGLPLRHPGSFESVVDGPMYGLRRLGEMARRLRRS